MFQHTSSFSLSGAFDLPPAWAWSETQVDKVKETLVNVVCGQSVKSDFEQIAFKKIGVMSIGAVTTRLTDILLMRKKRISLSPAWDQRHPFEEWQMAPHNLVVEDSFTTLTSHYDYVNVSNPRIHEERIVKIKPSATHSEIHDKIARITNLNPDEFMLVDHKEKIWIYPNSRPTTPAVKFARPLPRGGMQ